MKIILACILAMYCSNTFAFFNEEAQTSFKHIAAENISQQWGLAALDIPNKTIENDTTKWLTSIKVEQPIITPYVVNQLIQTTQKNQSFNSINATYINGRFSAKTGVLSSSKNISESEAFYLQGSYSIIQLENFNISLTAKIEAINTEELSISLAESKYMEVIQPSFEPISSNATIGITSSYSINKKWKLLGAITSTKFDEKIAQSSYIENSYIHIALIGTSYSF